MRRGELDGRHGYRRIERWRGAAQLVGEQAIPISRRLSDRGAQLAGLGPRGELDRLVRGMKVPLSDEGFLARCVFERKAFWVANPEEQPSAQDAPISSLALAPHPRFPSSRKKNRSVS